MNKEKIKRNEGFNTFLYFSAITANLAAFTLGSTYGWSSPAIPKLNGKVDSAENPLSQNITPHEESWIASLFPLGAAISAFLSGYLAERIGRKYALLVSSIPTIAGFAFLTFANEVSHFYIGRFLCGFGGGIVLVVTPIYLGEIAENTNRGTIGCFLLFFMTIGTLFVYLIAPFVNLKILSASNLIVQIIFVIVFGIFIPESPYYYIKKNKIEIAKQVLMKLRSNDVDAAQKELSVIVKSIDVSLAKEISFKEICYDKALIRSFCIAVGLVCFQQWAGINAVFFYMQSIFEETTKAIPSDYCTIIVSVIQVLAGACTLIIVDRFGRKLLLISSAIGTALSLFTTGIFFYIKEYSSINISGISWLPIVTINLFVISHTLGFGPIAYAMIGEIFPQHVKSFAATISIFVCLFCTFCVTNIFPYMKSLIGLGLSFCFLGCICCIGGFFVYIKVPETKGKRLEEIQEMLQN